MMLMRLRNTGDDDVAVEQRYQLGQGLRLRTGLSAASAAANVIFCLFRAGRTKIGPRRTRAPIAWGSAGGT